MSRSTFTARPLITAPAFGCIALLAGMALASCADTSTTDALSAADHGAHEPHSVVERPSNGDDRLTEGAAGSGEIPEAAPGSEPQSAEAAAGSGREPSAEAPSGAGPSPSPASAGQNPAPAGGVPSGAEAGSGAAPESSEQAPSAGVATLDPGSPSYEVPVSVELADFSRYQVASVQWRERNGERRLQYDLPADLIGHAQRVEFSGPATNDSSWSLRSDKFGEAECKQTGTEVVCHETLSGIEIDVEAVEARVNAGELDPGRLGVTRVFEADPIGILRFTLP
jgi:hypothetical protein